MSIAPVIHNTYECADLIQTDVKTILILWDRDFQNNLVPKYKKEIFISDKRAFTYNLPCVNNDNTISFYDESSPYEKDFGVTFYMGTFREILISNDIRLYYIHSNMFNDELIRKIDAIFPPIKPNQLELNKEQEIFYLPHFN